MGVTVLYHANCFDGYGAAWAASYALGAPSETTKYIPMMYGQPVPEIPVGDVIYMLDYSRSRKELEALSITNPLIVIDHHKSAQADCEGLPFCTFDMNHSGAYLAWRHFFPNEDVPWLIKYVEDRDLWRWELLKSREVSAYIASFPMDRVMWDQIYQALENRFDQVVVEGSAILRFQTQKVKDVCKHVQLITVGLYKVPVANSSLFMSEVGEQLLEMFPDAPFAGYYFDREDGRRQFGFRSKGFDVSEVAKMYGGGGHQKASGFELESPPVVWEYVKVG